MPSGYMKVVMGSKKPKPNFLGRYCMLQSWPDYSDPTVAKIKNKNQKFFENG